MSDDHRSQDNMFTRPSFSEEAHGHPVREHEYRMAQLEVIVTSHEKMIGALKSNFKTMDGRLCSIDNNFSKIKNWIIGAVVMYVAQSFGLLEAVKLWLGLRGAGG